MVLCPLRVFVYLVMLYIRTAHVRFCFFCATKVGGKAVDAMTVIGTDNRGEPKLAGETAVCGKWKGAFAMRLKQSQYDLHCSTVSF